MKNRTKWFIGIGSLVVVGAGLIITKKHWMPEKKSLPNKTEPTDTGSNKVVDTGLHTETEKPNPLGLAPDEIAKREKEALKAFNKLSPEDKLLPENIRASQRSSSFSGELSNSHLINI